MQSDFELDRRQSLPVRAIDAEQRNCDARIGRFCQWNSADDTIPPEEPRGITQCSSLRLIAVARQALLTKVAARRMDNRSAHPLSARDPVTIGCSRGSARACHCIWVVVRRTCAAWRFTKQNG